MAPAFLPAAAIAAAPTSSPTVTPADALAKLVAGNKRFVAADLPASNGLEDRRQLLVDGQTPHTAILTCADSRVIPNLVFVQGLGDLFVVRVAGNYPDDLVLASLDYAVEHLGTRLVMVLGHENCGAVKAVYQALATATPLPKQLAILETLMGPGIEQTVHDKGTQGDAVRANVHAAVQHLRVQPVLQGAAGSGRIRIVGAEYHLANGAVTMVE